MNSAWRRLLAGTLTSVPAVVVAQQATVVSGVVVSENGAPVQGAAVTIQSQGYGGITNAEGRYTFSVPASRSGVAAP